jgi:hypothetical protein
MGEASRRKIEALFDAEKNVDGLAALFCCARRAFGTTTEAASSASSSSDQVFSLTSHALADPLSRDG